MADIEITTQGRHVHFAEDGTTLPRPLCGRAPDPLRMNATGVCGACLTVLTGNELTGLPVLRLVGADCALAQACAVLYGPDPEPIPLAELVERSRKVPTA